METALFEAGGYRYIRGPFQYSGGVAAAAGFAIERARFPQPVPIEAGFTAIEHHLTSVGRPLTSFCACELRSSAPFTETEFVAFNRIYVGTLERWGIFRADENPVARSNVCPAINPPDQPSFEAFCYTVPANLGDVASFVISGAGDARAGTAPYHERIIRLGDTSTEAMKEKAAHVHNTMENRMSSISVSWADSTATQVYSVENVFPFMPDDIIRRGAAAHGLTWVYARPPVEGLAYEMDVRGVTVERVLQ